MNCSFAKKGFTLIELMVVISIIGLLSSVVIAGMQEARRKAEAKASVQVIKQIMNALELRYSDHGNYLEGLVQNTGGVIGVVQTNLVSGGYLPSTYTFPSLIRVAAVHANVDFSCGGNNFSTKAYVFYISVNNQGQKKYFEDMGFQDMWLGPAQNPTNLGDHATPYLCVEFK